MPPISDISTAGMVSNVYNKMDAAHVEEALGAVLEHSAAIASAHSTGFIGGSTNAQDTGFFGSGASALTGAGAALAVFDSQPCDSDVLPPLFAEDSKASFAYSIVSEEPMCVDSVGKQRSYGECWTKTTDPCQVCTCYDMHEVRCTARQCDAEPMCAAGKRRELEIDDGCCKSYRCVESKYAFHLIF